MGEEHFEIARGWTQPPPCFLAHAFTMDKSPWVMNTLKLQKVGLNHHLDFWLMLLQWIKPMGGGGGGGGGGGHYQNNVRLDSIIASSLAPYLNIVPSSLAFRTIIFFYLFIYFLFLFFWETIHYFEGL